MTGCLQSNIHLAISERVDSLSFWVPERTASARLSTSILGQFLVRPSASAPNTLVLSYVPSLGNIADVAIQWTGREWVINTLRHAQLDALVRLALPRGQPYVETSMALTPGAHMTALTVKFHSLADAGVVANGTVRQGSSWTALSRYDMIESFDPLHEPMAWASHYFFAIKTFDVNRLLAKRPPGTFVTRLSSDKKKFVISVVGKDAGTVHVPFERRGHQWFIDGRAFPSAKALLAAQLKLQHPLTRASAPREVMPPFVETEVVFSGETIGEGAGGEIWKGSLGGRTVAIKCLKNTEKEDLLQEAEVMLSVPRHRHINTLFGVVLSPVALVLEFVDGGSLDRLLDVEQGGAGGQVLTEHQVQTVGLGVAKGMAHLHANKVVHRDLASRNILVDKTWRAMVADFGMSRIMDDGEEGKTNSQIGPVKWMAPEQMRGKQRIFSEKTDVFSFAVLLTEMVNNTLPWDGASNVEAAMAVVSGERTVIGPRCSPKVLSIIEGCWEHDPAKRPLFRDVILLFQRE